MQASCILTSGEGVLLICSLKWNPNNVPTTCKATKRFVYWSSLKQPKICGFEKKKLKKGNWRSDNFSFYILVILKGIDFHVTVYHFSDIVFALHFLLNSFPCRVWNIQHIIAEVWRAKRACGAPWVSKSTHPRKFGNHVTVHRPSVRTTG